MGDAPVGIGAGVRITVSQVSRSGFDTDRWKMENPEAAKNYAKTTSYSKIDIREVGRVIRCR
jgi:predicted phage-related endonuclease